MNFYEKYLVKHLHGSKPTFIFALEKRKFFHS